MLAINIPTYAHPNNAGNLGYEYFISKGQNYGGMSNIGISVK